MHQHWPSEFPKRDKIFPTKKWWSPPLFTPCHFSAGVTFICPKIMKCHFSNFCRKKVLHTLDDFGVVICKSHVLCDIKTGFFFVFVPNPNHNTWFWTEKLRGEKYDHDPNLTRRWSPLQCRPKPVGAGGKGAMEHTRLTSTKRFTNLKVNLTVE